MRESKIDPSIEILKLIDGVGAMTRQTFSVECLTRGKTYKPPSKIMLTPAYFRSDSCLQCGKCCARAKTLVWSMRDWSERVLQIAPIDFEAHDMPISYYVTLLQNAKKVTLKIGERECEFMVYQQNRGCQLQHVDKESGKVLCGIQPVKPISCGLPLTTFVQMKKSRITYVRKHSNNRNWRLKCPLVFGEFDFERMKSSDLRWLVLMKDLAEDLGVETYLPDLVRFFHDAEGHLMREVIPKKNINFMTLLKQIKLF